MAVKPITHIRIPDILQVCQRERRLHTLPRWTLCILAPLHQSRTWEWRQNKARGSASSHTLQVDDHPVDCMTTTAPTSSPKHSLLKRYGRTSRTSNSKRLVVSKDCALQCQWRPKWERRARMSSLVTTLAFPRSTISIWLIAWLQITKTAFTYKNPFFGGVYLHPVHYSCISFTMITIFFSYHL